MKLIGECLSKYVINEKEAEINLTKNYRSHVISQDSMDVDDLMHRCLGFVCNGNIALDQNDIELLGAIERRLADMVYYDKPGRSRKKKIKLLISRIFLMLERISPEGCFFGIHPGDPGRVGFWPDRLRFKPERH